MKRLPIAILLLLMASGVSAQMVDDVPLSEGVTSTQPGVQAGIQSGIGIQPARSPFSLLDLSRISWSNSYSVAFFSGGNTSGSVGLWNTRVDYEISSKLHLALNLGVVHNPGALWNDENSKAQFLPGLRLDYRPSKNFFMTVSFQQYSGYNSPYSAWRGHRQYDPLFME